MLTEVEKRRYQYHLSGLSYAKIGELEKISPKNAHESVKKAKEKILKENNLTEPLNILRYEVDTLIQVSKNQYEIIKTQDNQIKNLHSMINSILTEIDQTSLKQNVQKLTSELVMMNRELIKLNRNQEKE